MQADSAAEGSAHSDCGKEGRWQQHQMDDRADSNDTCSRSREVSLLATLLRLRVFSSTDEPDICRHIALIVSVRCLALQDEWRISVGRHRVTIDCETMEHGDPWSICKVLLLFLAQRKTCLEKVSIRKRDDLLARQTIPFRHQ